MKTPIGRVIRFDAYRPVDLWISLRAFPTSPEGPTASTEAVNPGDTKVGIHFAIDKSNSSLVKAVCGGFILPLRALASSLSRAGHVLDGSVAIFAYALCAGLLLRRADFDPAGNLTRAGG